MKRLVIGLAIFGTFSNWLATLLAAFWGAGSMMAIASGGLAGTPWQEIIITVLLFALSFAMIAVSLLLLYGLRATRSDYATSTLITE
jgi:hydroxylaminobenzene mutase